MIVFYNIVQLLLLPILLLLLPFALCKKKYRDKIPSRLGFGLKDQTESAANTIWIHALSVGEINSVAPLVKSLYDDKSTPCRIVVSASTTAGKKRAEQILSQYCDDIIGAPFDLFFIVPIYISRIKPDIYIQVETDFWPNILAFLQIQRIPKILVNGRISKKSMASYRRFPLFFQPLFNSFELLCMQTQSDVDAMVKIGLSQEKVTCLGNLKFAQIPRTSSTHLPPFYTQITQGKNVLVAGSTHPGEEELLCSAFAEIKEKLPNTILFIAPRNIARGSEISQIANEYGLSSNLRSEGSEKLADIHIINTIGELLEFYSLADICLIGGSFIDFGGHNPLEPASLGKPVVFGPHMSAFEEIHQTLLNHKGAKQIQTGDLSAELLTLLQSPDQLHSLGLAGKECVLDHESGVLRSHRDRIVQLMDM